MKLLRLRSCCHLLSEEQPAALLITVGLYHTFNVLSSPFTIFSSFFCALSCFDWLRGAFFFVGVLTDSLIVTRFRDGNNGIHYTVSNAKLFLEQNYIVSCNDIIVRIFVVFRTNAVASMVIMDSLRGIYAGGGYAPRRGGRGVASLPPKIKKAFLKITRKGVDTKRCLRYN